MSSNKDEDLVHLNIKVSAETRYLFHRFSRLFNGGANEYLSKLVKEDIQKNHGDFVLEGVKFDYAAREEKEADKTKNSQFGEDFQDNSSTEIDPP